MNDPSALEVLAQELGEVAGRVERETRATVADCIAAVHREVSREREAFAAEMRAVRAEWEARLAAVSEVERRLTERMASLKDGEPGRDGSDGRDGASVSADDVLPAILARADVAVAENVERVLSAWEKPKDGASVTVADVEPMLREMVAAIPAPLDGKDGADADPEVIRSMVAEAVAAIPVPKDGRDGTDGASVTVDDVLPALEARVADLVAAIPAPRDGRDGTDGASVTVDDVLPALEARVADLVAAIPAPRDGRDGSDGKDIDPEAVRAMIAEHIAALPPAKDGEPGKSVTVEDVAPLIVDEVERRIAEHADMLSRQLDEAVAAIPVPKDGIDGKDGADGKLPMVREWADGVFYEGAVVTRDGGVYQALRDTGKEPGHADWLCIVERGKDGAPGRSFTVCGTYQPEAEYHELDVVALNGASFAARRDNPGECPGEGWQMIAMQGKQGKPGQSIKGDRGSAATVTAARISDDGLLTIVNADGSAVECDLYPVLSRLG